MPLTWVPIPVILGIPGGCSCIIQPLHMPSSPSVRLCVSSSSVDSPSASSLPSALGLHCCARAFSSWQRAGGHSLAGVCGLLVKCGL